MAQTSRPRAFTPQSGAIGRLHPTQPSDFVINDEDNEISRISPSRRSTKQYAAIFIDGACRLNGQAGARASFGIFFAPGSRHNCCGTLPNWASHTSQNAEIYAAQQAVNIVRSNADWEVLKDGVVFITDSDYVYRSITEYIYSWRTNGFLDASGRPLVNGGATSVLHDSICELEAKGIEVFFWRVDREHNQDADRLANSALGPPRRGGRRLPPVDVGYVTLEWNESP